jgi:hypothetical protein
MVSRPAGPRRQPFAWLVRRVGAHYVRAGHESIGGGTARTSRVRRSIGPLIEGSATSPFESFSLAITTGMGASGGVLQAAVVVRPCRRLNSQMTPVAATPAPTATAVIV